MPYYGQFLPDLTYGTERFRPGENPYFADMALSEVAPLVTGDYADSPPDEQLPPPMVPGPRPVPAPMPHIQMPEQFDPGDINVRDRIGQEGTSIPNYPPPEPPRGPSRWRQVAGIAGRALQAGIDAAAVPNIAGGGGTDIMRALSASRGAELNRDMAAAQMARQHAQDEEMRRYREAQIAENQAQAAWYRHRANEEAKIQPIKLIEDKFGNMVHPITGQIVRAAPPQSVKPKVEYKEIQTNEGTKLVAITDSGAPTQTLPDGTIIGGQTATTIASYAARPSNQQPQILTDASGRNYFVRQNADGTTTKVFTGVTSRLPTDPNAPKRPTKQQLINEQNALKKDLDAIDKADKDPHTGQLKGVDPNYHRQKKQEVLDEYYKRLDNMGLEEGRDYQRIELPPPSQEAIDVYAFSQLPEEEKVKWAGDVTKWRANKPRKGNAPISSAPAQPPSATVQQKPPATAAPARQPTAPPVGTVDGGYRFKGGDPADPNNWERVR